MLGRPGVVNGWRAQTRSSTSALKNEEIAPPTEIVDCKGTMRVWPKQTVAASPAAGAARRVIGARAWFRRSRKAARVVDRPDARPPH
jgi:hypothetical protein